MSTVRTILIRASVAGRPRSVNIRHGGGVGLSSYEQVSGLPDYPETFPCDPHSHLSAEISDATNTGEAEKVIATDTMGSFSLPYAGGTVRLGGADQNAIARGTQNLLPWTWSINVSGLTADRIYQLPNASGAFALTTSNSGIPDKLHNGTISGLTTVSSGATWSYADAAAKAAHLTALGGGQAGRDLFGAALHTGTGSTRKLMGLDVTDSVSFSAVGATTPGTGAFTSLSASGALTLSAGSISFPNSSAYGITWSGRLTIRPGVSDGTMFVYNSALSALASLTSLYHRFGSGSPEGVVTAPIGAIYSRTDGGAGTSFYVKESGTGNTGWVAK